MYTRRDGTLGFSANRTEPLSDIVTAFEKSRTTMVACLATLPRFFVLKLILRLKFYSKIKLVACLRVHGLVVFHIATSVDSYSVKYVIVIIFLIPAPVP